MFEKIEIPQWIKEQKREALKAIKNVDHILENDIMLELNLYRHYAKNMTECEKYLK